VDDDDDDDIFILLSLIMRSLCYVFLYFREFSI